MINFIGMVESESSRKTTPQSASRPSTTVCCVDVVKYTTLMLVKFVVKFHATCIHTYHSLFSTYTYTLTHTHTQHTDLIVQMQTRPRRRVTLCVCVYDVHSLIVCLWLSGSGLFAVLTKMKNLRVVRRRKKIETTKKTHILLIDRDLLNTNSIVVNSF